MMRLPRRHAGIATDPLLHDRAGRGRMRQEGPRAPASAASAAASRAAASAAAHRRRLRPRPRPAPRAPTEDEIWAKLTVADLNKQGVLADVFFDLDMYGVREDGRGAAAEERRLHEAVAVTARHRRRPLRRTWHRRVQPEPRRASLHRREGLSREPRHRRPIASPSSARARRRPSAPTATRAAGSRTAAATS